MGALQNDKKKEMKKDLRSRSMIRISLDLTGLEADTMIKLNVVTSLGTALIKCQHLAFQNEFQKITT